MYERRRRAFLDAAVVAVILAIAVSALPPLYVVEVVGWRPKSAIPAEVLLHGGMNVAVNVTVAIWSLRLGGRLDRKMAGVLSRALLGHGFLAFIILTTRQFHSNQVMLTALGVSVLLGLAAMFVRHNLFRPKIAILGSSGLAVLTPGLTADCIDDFETDLYGYDVLLVPTMTDLSPEWTSALTRAMIMGKPVRHVAEYIEEQGGTVSLEHFDSEHLPAAGLTSYRARKRLLDIALVLLSAPIVLPVLGLAALVVLVTMGRPVLFVQSRVGLGGESFRMFKLRTMRIPDALEVARATTSGGDDRITPVGRFLRRFRIDELPQLWHVLKGDMSVVGPRPEWTTLSDSYIQALPAYAYRHLVRPGITGWAQVKGGYASDLSETRVKVGYDLFYIKNLSLGLDLQILARTCWTLVSGGGAR